MIDKILEIALEILFFFRRKRKGKRTKGHPSAPGFRCRDKE